MAIPATLIGQDDVPLHGGDAVHQLHRIGRRESQQVHRPARQPQHSHDQLPEAVIPKPLPQTDVHKERGISARRFPGLAPPQQFQRAFGNFVHRP